jgi:large subunit ribosomal protein L9
MKVMLTQDVDELGLAGEVKDVANGFGRNYLIPQGLAVLATPGALKQADVHRRRAAERRQRIADEMAFLAESIRRTTLVFQAKAGEKGRLYGSVTTAEIADKLAEAVEHEIDRRKISLESPIKQLGTHTVTLRLAQNVVADFDVVVESIDADDTPDQEEPVASSEEAEPLAELAEVDEASDAE